MAVVLHCPTAATMSATHSTNFHHKHRQHRAGTVFFEASTPGVSAATDTAPTIEAVEPEAVAPAAAAAATASSAAAALAALVLQVSTKDSSSSAGATEAAVIGLNDTNDGIIKSGSSSNNVNGDGGEDNADADTDTATEGGPEKRSVARTSSRGSSVVSDDRWTRRKRAVRFCTVLKVYLIPRAKDYSESDASRCWWSRAQLDRNLREFQEPRLLAAVAPTTRRARRTATTLTTTTTTTTTITRITAATATRSGSAVLGSAVAFRRRLPRDRYRQQQQQLQQQQLQQERSFGRIFVGPGGVDSTSW